MTTRRNVNTYPMDLDAIRGRFRRLIRAMKWVACLTDTEAANAIYMHQIGDRFAGEAVNHFGGVPAVLTRAIATRHVVRRLIRDRLIVA